MVRPYAEKGYTGCTYRDIPSHFTVTFYQIGVLKGHQQQQLGEGGRRLYYCSMQETTTATHTVGAALQYYCTVVQYTIGVFKDSKSSSERGGPCISFVFMFAR